MPSPYNTESVNFDDFFEPRGSTTARANVGFQDGGVDIAQLYMASTGWDDRPLRNSHYTSGGVDLSTLFRRKGYVPPPPPPVITSVSNNGPVYVGQTITLTCVASGADNYTWRRVGTGDLVGSGSTCSFTATSTTGNTYSCEASNDGGSVFDSTTVTVNAVPASTVSITGPSSVAAGSFNGETWTLSASNAAGLTRVIFFVDGHTLMNWTTVSGTSYGDSVTWVNGFGVPSISNTPGTYTFSFWAEASGTVITTDSITVTVT